MRSNPSPSHPLTAHIIQGTENPWFEIAFKILNDYFGERGEMETHELIVSRFLWDPSQQQDGFSLLYEMVVLTDEQEYIVAVGDYSVILHHAAIQAGAAAVVHLSHVYANPQKPRRDILNKYVPKLTAQAARAALLKAGLPITTPITLAAEMEPYDADNQERSRRIQRFLLAGLSMVDPQVIRYFQPDFRAPAVIDEAGGAERLLLTLMVRRLGREEEEKTVAGEILHIVNCLYYMYAQGIRKQDMELVFRSLQAFPQPNSIVRLIKRL